MDHADLEGLAELLYREAGFDPDEPVSPVRIARAILGGSSAVRIVPRDALRWASAALVPVNGQFRIFVSSAVPTNDVNHHVGHELGHWALRREDFRGSKEEEEEAADRIGAALVAPRHAFQRAIRALGEDVETLADAFGTTQTLVALRMGEIVGKDLALVRPGLVRVRGQLSFVWPEEHVIRRWATGTPPPGVVKARLTDDERRILLLAEDVEETG